MKIIIDTTVFMSALISPLGTCAELIMNPVLKFEKFSCYFLIAELFKHKEKIIKHTRLSEDEIIEQIYYLIKNLTLINEEQIPIDIWKRAYNLTINVDQKDTPFVALTEFIGGKLWTLDKILIKGLQAKGFNSFISIIELKSLI